MRLILAWASVASVTMWLPVGVGTAYAWLARQDLVQAPPHVQNLATAWLVFGASYPAVSTLAVLLAWHFHRNNQDRWTARIIAIPGIFVVANLLLAVTTIGVSRPYMR